MRITTIKTPYDNKKDKGSPVEEVAVAVEVNPTKTSALRGRSSHVAILHHEPCYVDEYHKYEDS